MVVTTRSPIEELEGRIYLIKYGAYSQLNCRICKKKKNPRLVQLLTKASLKLELDIQGKGSSLTATHLHLVIARLESTAVKVHQVNI